MDSCFLRIYGSRFNSLFFNQNGATLYFLNYKNTSATFKVYILKPCPIIKFCIIADVLPLTPHVLLLATHMLPVTCHCSLLMS